MPPVGVAFFVVTLSGIAKNTSVRARRFIADALRMFPFKGVGDSREKVRFRLVKVHHNATHEGGFFRGDLIGKTKNTSVRALSLLFGVAKAIYRRCSAASLIIQRFSRLSAKK